jgi:hypothetical protein
MRRSDQPTHNTRGRQSASFPECTEVRPRQRAAAVTSTRNPSGAFDELEIVPVANRSPSASPVVGAAGGAHFECVRLNTTLTIRQNQFEDAGVVRALLLERETVGASAR